jgi:hypothetical protein
MLYLQHALSADSSVVFTVGEPRFVADIVEGTPSECQRSSQFSILYLLAQNQEPVKELLSLPLLCQHCLYLSVVGKCHLHTL